MAVLSITRLKLRSYSYLMTFLVQNEQVLKQIRQSEGFIKGKEMATVDLSMWTSTLWASEKLLKAFYLSGSHRQVMPKLNVWTSEAVSGHRESNTLELPSWYEVRDELDSIGHFIKLSHPSLNHQQQIIPVPRVAFIRSINPI
ncbi:hypothetical protein [Anabaena catenula]|uniref:GST C-terminal domain-containing protein n=1 Tax=Anabaena catenula FACHB-362 TaxID=2692877 RepID=A0ABR8JEQ2_9NOST|nr:hypothetical protein [Anabaena catenula]MBD2695161.1 hypothetical protein [Anabaena catenula FACHB-362]